MQDASGAADDGTVDARPTLDKLRDAVVAAGGPVYDYRWIDPSELATSDVVPWALDVWALLTAPPDTLDLTPRSLSDWLDEMEKL